MRLSLRFVIPLLVALSLLGYLTVPLMERLTTRWFMRDLDLRAQLIADSLQDEVAGLVEQRAAGRLPLLFNRVIRDERLHAIGICSARGRVLYATATFPRANGCAVLPAADGHAGAIRQEGGGALYVSRFPAATGAETLGDLVLMQDMGFMAVRSADTRRYLVALFIVLAVVVSLITVFVAQLSWRGWIAGVKSFLRGEGLLRPFSPGGSEPPAVEIRPLIGDVRALIREVSAERTVPEDVTASWNAGTLRRLLVERFYGDQVIVVSNREPYIHEREDGGAIRVRRPASGLVTAVEPVMRACSGTWIAHGSGSADSAVTDARDCVAVPPDDPAYELKRIWLSAEEEQGYYFGLANEGLWPLCHMAHVRPVFRRGDWVQYQRVNRRFAQAVVAAARTEDPVVLVQDYHLALVPRLVRDALPRATVISFWHIPWPNQEVFGICPWREDLIAGLLGSTIVGFHTAQHCRNFLETVDRYLEARIEHESATVSHQGQLTRVAGYPISIEWPAAAPAGAPAADRAALRARLGIAPDALVALGVDRLDYTKGIVERMQAVEAMLLRHPELAARFVFIQIAAPTRSALDEYQMFEERVRATAARINARFGAGADRPVRLLVEHHDSGSVFDHYRACDVCMVTSLHDGMNLVAKEFVSAREDEGGALVLSQFAGASRELHEALIVNPYDIDQTAGALHRALVMQPAEQRERMRSMRNRVRDFNIYRWAGRMLLDAAAVRERERVMARISLHRDGQPKARGARRRGVPTDRMAS